MLSWNASNAGAAITTVHNDQWSWREPTVAFIGRRPVIDVLAENMAPPMTPERTGNVDSRPALGTVSV